MIGGVRYSLWKTDEPLAARAPRFSRAFFLTTILGTAGLLAVASWVAGRIRQGDFLLGNVFVVTLCITLYGVPVFLVWQQRRRRPLVGVPEMPPRELPPDAVATFAVLRGRGRCLGWLWIDRDHLRFRGAGFDFDLKREDLATKGALGRKLRAVVLLRRPKGISDHRLYLHPGSIVDGAFVSDPSRWSGLEARIVEWERRAPSHEPSLLPPLRPVPTRRATVGVGQILFPMLFMGLIVGMAGVFISNNVPPPSGGRSPWTLAAAGALYGLMWPFLLWTSDSTARGYEREAEKAKRRAEKA